MKPKPLKIGDNVRPTKQWRAMNRRCPALVPTGQIQAIDRSYIRVASDPRFFDPIVFVRIQKLPKR